MNYLTAAIQGIIQGLTEFLPVSSSGHLSIYQHFTGINGEASGMFSVLLHMGTLVSVAVAFWKEIRELILTFVGIIKDAAGRNLTRGSFEKGPRHLFLLFVISELPLLFFYFLNDFYDSLAADSDIVVEGACFLLTAALLILSGRAAAKRKCPTEGDTMTWKQALAMGIMQGIAPLPGLSRSGSTISTGLIWGVSRDQAVSFSFIMGLPVVLAANVLELIDIIKDGISVEWGPALLGMAVAAVVGILAIKTVQLLVRNRRFTYFAYYLIALGGIVTVIGIIEHIAGIQIHF